MAQSIRTRPSLLLSQSLPSGSLNKLLILLHQKAERMKTTITKKLIKLITWIEAASGGYSLVLVRGLLVAMASLVAEHEL